MRKTCSALLPALCAILIAGTGMAQAAASRHATDGRIRVAGLANPATQNEINLPCGETLNPVAQLQQPPATSGKPALMNQPGIDKVAINTGVAQTPVAIDQTICDGTICVSLPAVAASIHKQLDCNVMGYAFFVGNALTGAKAVFGSYGQARTAANPPKAKFTPDSKMQIASTSKVLTALATLKVMGSNVNKPANNWFPPGWSLPANSFVKQITVRRFISQTSGVMKYDAGQEDDASLKTFFSQNYDPNAAYNCGGPPNIVTSSQPCYSNANFSIMRLVLPRYSGTSSSDPMTVANAYVSIVWQNVFNPVGVNDVGCQVKQTAAYALAYNVPTTQPGTDFGGDLRLSCGAWGWWVSVRDYAAVLVSLNAQDGKILGNCGLNDMVTNPSNHPVGWDIPSSDGRRWVEKNGGDTWGTSAGSGVVSTSVGIYGGRDGCVVKGKGTAPIPGVAAVLFINSNIKGVGYGADTVLLNALQAATTPDH
jgi:CubicO group peptidase (beta-lactamase class C family)